MTRNKYNKGIKKNHILLIALIFLIFGLGVFLYSNLIDYLSVLEKQEIYAEIIVSDHYGINLNGTALMFGMITPGSSSTRELIVGNNYNHNVKIEVFVDGNIDNFMQVSDNEFVLEKDEVKKLAFSVFAPEDIEYGVYNGKVSVIIRNPVVK